MKLHSLTPELTYVLVYTGSQLDSEKYANIFCLDGLDAVALPPSCFPHVFPKDEE